MGINWKWNDSYTTTIYTTGKPIEIKAPEWKIGEKIEINSPIWEYKPATPQGWVCPKCGRANAPWVSQCDCSGNIYRKVGAFSSSPCQTCSNNPANSGSGNCNCTLGTCPVTC